MSSMVSVIIPTYNRAEYLLSALGSVVEDAYADKQIIVVDDGSTDNTAQLVAEYRDQVGVNIVYSYQENSGAASARNRGIELSEGEYIQFLDSDDLLVLGKLERSVRAFESNPALVMVYTDIESFDGQNKTSREAYHKNISALSGLDRSDFLVDMQTSMPLWKRSFLLANEIQWASDVYCWNEAVFNYRALSKVKNRKAVRHIPMVGLSYRTHPDQMGGGKFTEKYIIGEAEAVEKIRLSMESDEERSLSSWRFDSLLKSLLYRSALIQSPLALETVRRIARRWPTAYLTKLFFYIPSGAMMFFVKFRRRLLKRAPL